MFLANMFCLLRSSVSKQITSLRQVVCKDLEQKIKTSSQGQRHGFVGKVLAGYAGLRTGVWILTFQVGRAVTSSLRVEKSSGQVGKTDQPYGWVDSIMTTESIQERHTTSLSSLHVHIHHSHTSGCSHICEHTYKCLSILYSQTHVKMLIQLTSARMLNSKLEFNSLLKFTNLLKWGNNTWEKIASKEFNN